MSPQVNLEELGPGRIPSPRSAAGGPPAALPDVDQARIARLTGALAPASVASYGRGWRLWADFAGAEGHTALPAEPEPLARFVDSLAGRGYKPASIHAALAAVGAAHRYSGATNPARSEDVRAAVKGAVREHRDAGGTLRQSAGITAEGLAAIEATAARPRRRGRGWESPGAAARARLDVALVRTMRDALARVSEAAAWQWGQVQPGPDGSATLTFRRPKTDTDSTSFLSPATAGALAAIRPPDVDAEARVFGLSTSQLQRRIAAAAKAAGLEGVSSHGCRVGMAQDLARTREELPAIMQAGGWKNERMVARYTARERAGRGAVARFYAAKGEHP